MFSSKIKPIIEKLDDEFRKIHIKKHHNLLTVTSTLGRAFKKYNNNSSFQHKNESKSCLNN